MYTQMLPSFQLMLPLPSFQLMLSLPSFQLMLPYLVIVSVPSSTLSIYETEFQNSFE